MAPPSGQHLRRAIGERLRQIRLSAGITSQEKLAELAGVHRTYIGRLERGESGVTVETLAAILASADTSLAEFFKPFDRPMRPRTPRRRDPEH
jgi:transcriptional regulator with XRE-family HTH domain